ncbi:uncharacterized protein LOC128760685 [Synchiropus splendidus]|uniref:uncharacterized protein LOC128760685 n=1 Tax=Synchiropus splendidus TaxID=270530 RepID=UPI00237DDE1A|nr:uncharacterized protein LOC128760685 [Synchiropus splendidus]
MTLLNGDRQRASVVGASTYSLMRNILSPDRPKDKTYQELVNLLKNHFDPKPSEIVQRYKFDSRSRMPGESVMDFVAELRRVAQDCNYGDTLQQMLRDRIVCSINDDRIQRRLLAETDLTVDKALSIAVASETATGNAQDLQNPGAKCFKVKQGSPVVDKSPGVVKECYKCKGQHNTSECRFKSGKCHACGNLGHIARACRDKKTQKWGQKPEDRKKKTTRSGIYRSHKVQVKQEDCQSSEEGDPVKVIGTAVVNVKYHQQSATLPNLLGRSWLEKICLHWKEIKRNAGQEENRSVHRKALHLSEKKVFKNELGTLRGTKATIHVKDNPVPRFF